MTRNSTRSACTSTRGRSVSRSCHLSAVGRHLFGNGKYFPSDNEVHARSTGRTRRGRTGLRGRWPGLEAIKLVEYQRFWGGQFKESEVRKASDIFAALGDGRRNYLAGGELKRAVFSVKLRGEPKGGKSRSGRITSPFTTAIQIASWWNCGCGIRGSSSLRRAGRMRRLRRLWSAFETIPGLTADRLEWQRRLEDEWPVAEPLLRRTGRVVEQVWCPSPSGDGCPRSIVLHPDGRIVAVCGDRPMRCDPLPLSPDDIAVLAIDRAKLAAALARVFELDATTAAPISPAAYLLGEHVVASGSGFPGGALGSSAVLPRAFCGASSVAGRSDTRSVSGPHAAGASC